MERIFGITLYGIGYIMMVTMVLNALGVIERTGPLGTAAFLVFGYLLCLTGFMFARRASSPFSG